jgi:hypothetical protein
MAKLKLMKMLSLSILLSGSSFCGISSAKTCIEKYNLPDANYDCELDRGNGMELVKKNIEFVTAQGGAYVNIVSYGLKIPQFGEGVVNGEGHQMQGECVENADGFKLVNAANINMQDPKNSELAEVDVYAPNSMIAEFTVSRWRLVETRQGRSKIRSKGEYLGTLRCVKVGG